jgi:SAM-dependent methyltransferase
MVGQDRHDNWQAGGNYDGYMGRWSRKIAPPFLAWLDLPKGHDWLEIGCGTGALSGEILRTADPATLLAIDPSEGYLAEARRNAGDRRASFEIGDAQSLQVADRSRDTVVSALVLNFVPHRAQALSEMVRVASPGGTVAFYVWGYPGGGVEFMRAFWTAAIALDPGAADLAEGRRFPFCNPPDLTALAAAAGMSAVAWTALEQPAVFTDFDDYWRPFTKGTGPAPGYCANLLPARREKLRDELQRRLPRAQDGSIPLRLRAWAIRGTAP